jgi:hypothetical protein
VTATLEQAVVSALASTAMTAQHVVMIGMSVPLVAPSVMTVRHARNAQTALASTVMTAQHVVTIVMTVRHVALARIARIARFALDATIVATALNDVIRRSTLTSPTSPCSLQKTTSYSSA